MAWLADFLITRSFQRLQSSPFANWNDLYRHELGSDVLIMGSSRAYVQFNPRILDSLLNVNSYNLGCDGRAVDTQILKYKVYRHRQHTKPRLILYELYPGSMDTSNQYDRIQFLPYLHDPYLWQLTHRMEHFSVADGFVPCWRYLNFKKEVKEILNGSSPYTLPENALYKGFLDFDLPWNGAAFHHIDTIKYQHNTKTIKEFDKFLDDCEKEDISVVFVLAPYYIGATRKIHDLEGMHKMFDTLAKKHDIPVLDYTDNYLSQDTTYFYNATHLNRTGATLFTTQLAHDVDSIFHIKHP